MREGNNICKMPYQTTMSVYVCKYPTVQENRYVSCSDMNRRRYEKPWVHIVGHQPLLLIAQSELRLYQRTKNHIDSNACNAHC